MKIEREKGYISNLSVSLNEIAKIRLLHSDSPRTLEQWQKQTGASIAMTASLVERKNGKNGVPIETFKSDGVEFGKSNWCTLGFGICTDQKSVIFCDYNLTPWFLDFTCAFPMLLYDGAKYSYIGAENVAGRQPRAVFSQTLDGFRITIVDGRQKGMPGMDLPELADYLHQQGDIIHSANLDGGGAAGCYVIGSGYINSPCENRRLYTALLIWTESDDNKDVETILKTAAGEIGTEEYPANSNKVKYNTEYYGSAVSGNGYPWCCAFMWWIFQKAGLSQLFFGGAKTAYCPAVETYYRHIGQWFSSDPKVGDLVLFDFYGKGEAVHIGIVEKVNSDGSIVSIEGNTSLTSDDNGGAVMRRTRYPNVIRGYARPSYNGQAVIQNNAENAKKEGFVMVELPVLKKGSKGQTVKSLQTLLIGAGISCGGAGADGDFGAATDSAVRAFQKKRSLIVDGIVGQNTWDSLLNGGA